MDKHMPAEAPRESSRIEQRLAELRHEYEAGQTQMRALEQRTRELQNTMQRIAGAIAVLEEMLIEERANRPAE
jgi:chromosome segregation ATPase